MARNAKKENDSGMNKRWGTYAVAGLAAVAAGSQNAEADIVHVVVGAANNGALSGDASFSSELAADAILNFYHGTFDSNGETLGFAGVEIVDAGGALNGGIAGTLSTGGSFFLANNLAFGADLAVQNFGSTSAATLAFGNGGYGSEFEDAGTGYIGFTFENGTRLGWARVTTQGNQPLNDFVVEEFAFADAGETLTVGQTAAIPEPASLGLLALGAAGVALSRRKRNGHVSQAS